MNSVANDVAIRLNWIAGHMTLCLSICFCLDAGRAGGPCPPCLYALSPGSGQEYPARLPRGLTGTELRSRIRDGATDEIAHRVAFVDGAGTGSRHRDCHH